MLHPALGTVGTLAVRRGTDCNRCTSRGPSPCRRARSAKATPRKAPSGQSARQKRGTTRFSAYDGQEGEAAPARSDESGTAHWSTRATQARRAPRRWFAWPSGESLSETFSRPRTLKVLRDWENSHAHAAHEDTDWVEPPANHAARQGGAEQSEEAVVLPGLPTPGAVRRDAARPRAGQGRPENTTAGGGACRTGKSSRRKRARR